jgi:hypothetical protein
MTLIEQESAAAATAKQTSANNATPRRLSPLLDHARSQGTPHRELGIGVEPALVIEVVVDQIDAGLRRDRRPSTPGPAVDRNP